MKFSFFEISTMTAEEREFYLSWFSETRRKENEAQEGSNSPAPQEAKFGPGA